MIHRARSAVAQRLPFAAALLAGLLLAACGQTGALVHPGDSENTQHKHKSSDDSTWKKPQKQEEPNADGEDQP